MAQTPPFLAHETFVRVLRLARFDGLSILAIAGPFALLAAGFGDLQGAMLGLIVTAAGALELHGVAVLRHGEARGMKWLVGSQAFLLTAMLSYCALRLTHVDLGQLRAGFHSALQYPPVQEMWAVNQEIGVNEDVFLRQVYTLVYFSVAIATLIYQGGMILYYLRRREAVAQALADE